MLIVHEFSATAKRLAELLWAYEADEPHYHCDRGPGHYPAITWAEFATYTSRPHEGDCTGKPATCVRCVVEEVVNKACWLAERLPAPCPAAPDPVPTGKTEAPIKLHLDHPRELALSLLDYTPTIRKRGSDLVISFDEPEQAADVYDLLWNAISAARIETALPCEDDDDAPTDTSVATGAG